MRSCVAIPYPLFRWARIRETQIIPEAFLVSAVSVEFPMADGCTVVGLTPSADVRLDDGGEIKRFVPRKLVKK